MMMGLLVVGACAGRSACARVPPPQEPAPSTPSPSEWPSAVTPPPADAAPALPCGTSAPWPLWEGYVTTFIQADGRVIDHTGGGHSTSEGQAYALFHALVANDRRTFDKVLGWTGKQLAKGDLGANLPAWKWGKRDDGTWGVLDENAASDADVWIAYTLYEAARMWREASYAVLARKLAAQVTEREVRDLPGLGATLLPAPFGFDLEDGSYRLNPSYLPLQVLRGLVSNRAPGPWEGITRSSVQVIVGAAQHGLVPDWIGWSAERGFVVDSVTGPVGSYDAIRCYLWAGTLHDDDDDKATLATNLGGMVKLWEARGYVPEKVNPPLELAFFNPAPVGFQAALLPDIQVAGTVEQLMRLQGQIEATANGKGLYGTPPTYYDTNLLLFGKGFVEGRYRFAPDGHLSTPWAEACTP